jgi:hypothetical protein
VSAAELTASAEGPDAFALVDQLLRDRPAILRRIAAGDDLAGLVRTWILTIVVGMALVGAALGAFRGGAQIAYAAIKLPLVLLLTAALSAPVLSAGRLALGRRASLAQDLALVVTALAFGSLVLVAQAPVLLAMTALRVGYHEAILVTAVCFTIGGLASVSVLLRGAGDALAALAILLGVFAVVGSQLAWTLRPYLVRPRSQEVPFVRAIEGSLWDALNDTARSAQGIYPDEWETR